MRILYSLSMLGHSAFEYAQALEDGQASLRLSRELGWRLMEASIQNGIAAVLEACGDYEAARAGYARCLEIAREIGDRAMEAMALINLASVDLGTGQYERALEYAGQGLALAREVGQGYFEAYAQGFRAYAHYELGQYAEAIDAYQKALDLLSDMGLTNEAMAAGWAGPCLPGPGRSRRRAGLCGGDPEPPGDLRTGGDSRALAGLLGLLSRPAGKRRPPRRGGPGRGTYTAARDRSQDRRRAAAGLVP